MILFICSSIYTHRSRHRSRHSCSNNVYKIQCYIQFYMFLYHVCKWDIFVTLTSAAFCRLLGFLNNQFRKLLSGIPSVSNSLDRDQAWHFIEPKLGPTRLQMLSAVDTSLQRVKVGVGSLKVNYIGQNWMKYIESIHNSTISFYVYLSQCSDIVFYLDYSD